VHISLAYIKNVKNLTIQFSFIIYYKKLSKVKFFLLEEEIIVHTIIFDFL